jgi:hypothetical protein
MSETKQRGPSAGQPKSELTKLKDLWRSTLSDDARDYWRSRCASGDFTQAQIRAELRTKLKVTLTRDNQLTEFRQWLEAQDQRELLAAKAEERKSELLAGGMTLEEAQEVLLAEAAAYSTTARDFKIGLKVSAEISKKTATALDRDKFKEAMRSKLESGLAELAQHIKGNARAQEAYAAFRATIAESTK